MRSAILSLEYLMVHLIISNGNMLEAQTMQQDQGVLLKLISEQKLLLKLPYSSLKLLSYSSDKIGCVSYCLTYSSCKCANFRISTGECSLYGLNSWEIEFTIVSDTDNIIIQKLGGNVVTHGEWTLVFRGLANIGKSVYDAYTNTSLSHDQPLSPMYPIGCLRLDTNLSCDHHFRSNLLNNWSNLIIPEVKFSIYKDGIMQKFLLFNGSSSTVLDWFSPGRLQRCSWVDLPMSPVAYFTIVGSHTTQDDRRFYIQNILKGCDADSGWFVSIDHKGDNCAWGNKASTFPRFLYSPLDSKILNNNMITADVIAIFIKY